MKAFPDKLVSGGQTGADRTALDWAIAHGIPHGGWCPKGRLAEDGPIDSRYQLKATPTSSYTQRTEWNVRDSDGTVVFSINSVLTGGSRKAVDFANAHRKPVLHLWREGGPADAAELLLRFIVEHHIRVLNVAGPRASNEAEVGTFATKVLDAAWAVAKPATPSTPATVTTDRLVLRPLVVSDAADVARLAGRREIADTTISIPHPYSQQQAHDWIVTHTCGNEGKEVVFAITTKADGHLIGGVGLCGIDSEYSKAEMGFWIGVDWWGQGYATEAAAAVLRFAFNELNLNRVCAHHMVRNSASGRVMEKIGMKREGLLRQYVRKWGRFEDVEIYAILRAEWQSARAAGEVGPTAGSS